MTGLEGKPEEYVEEPKGSRQFQRYVDGWPVGGPTWVREGVTFAEIYDRRANPPPPEPDPRDAEIADLKAGMAALKKSGVLTDRMIDAERVALSRKE